jgi:hypothetical protein
MKTLLITFLLLIGSVCQGQFWGGDTLLMRSDGNHKSEYNLGIMLPQYERMEPGFTADMFRAVYNYCEKLADKVYSLEKRITELEYNCLVIRVDSVVFGYEYRFWETDSTKMTGNPVYSRRYRVKPFKIKQ